MLPVLLSLVYFTNEFIDNNEVVYIVLLTIDYYHIILNIEINKILDQFMANFIVQNYYQSLFITE